MRGNVLVFIGKVNLLFIFLYIREKVVPTAAVKKHGFVISHTVKIHIFPLYEKYYSYLSQICIGFTDSIK